MILLRWVSVAGSGNGLGTSSSRVTRPLLSVIRTLGIMRGLTCRRFHLPGSGTRRVRAAQTVYTALGTRSRSSRVNLACVYCPLRLGLVSSIFTLPLAFNHSPSVIGLVLRKSTASSPGQPVAAQDGLVEASFGTKVSFVSGS